jgi:capsular polysaccharide export protein
MVGKNAAKRRVRQKSRPRHYLLLQGPCGRFFGQMQRGLVKRGHRATRVAFNGGDLFDAGLTNHVLYRRSLADWPGWVRAFAVANSITDLVVYGDCRPYHRHAIAQLKKLGVRIHVLEEGYLRPNWVTCEADGVNGHSGVIDLDLDAYGGKQIETTPTNDEVKISGAHLRYMAAGFVYYFWTCLLFALFPRYVSHRELGVVTESALWFRRLLTWPLRRIRTERALRAIAAARRPIHLALLQLSGDSQIREHSNFRAPGEFIDYCCREFATSGVHEQLLVFKNHPLDNGIVDLGRAVREAAHRHNLQGRVFFLETPKLVPLLEQSKSVIAINSTACHQALRRGIPTLALGRAIFCHPRIVPNMRLADFFRLQPAVDIVQYNKLVNLLRRTSQFNGSYYTKPGRAVLLPYLLRRLEVGPRSIEAYRLDVTRAAGVRFAS